MARTTDENLGRDGVTDEYTVTRVDLGGLRSIVVRLAEHGAHEVLADHATPRSEIDAYVRAALVQVLKDHRSRNDGEDPAASA